MYHHKSFLFYCYRLIIIIIGLNSCTWSLSQHNIFSFDELTKFPEIAQVFFWHLSIPTVGLHKKECSYYYIPHFFSLWQLCPQKGKGVKAALLDTGVAAFSTESCSSHPHICHPTPSAQLDVTTLHTKLLPLIEEKGLYAAHGTHCYGLINARNESKPIGLAPQADVFMIKIGNGKGVSDRDALIRGLKKAITLGCQVVNIGIALVEPLIIDDQQTKKLINLMQKIPYIIAPVGNQGLKFIQNPCIVPTIAYPAAFECVAFDVGAFGYDALSHRYPVCSFSQFQKNSSPKFLAPGFNILSTSIPTNTCNDAYSFCHGTSMASALMAGFVILMLAEFGNDFSKQQLLKVCYTSCIRLHDDQDWKEKTMLGTLDMPTALFTLHVLRSVKVNLKDEVYSFGLRFDNILKAIQWILRRSITLSKNKSVDSTSFINNFAAFELHAKKMRESSQEKVFMPKTVDEAIEFVAQPIIFIINQSKVDYKNMMNIHDNELLKNILYQKVDLFDWLKSECKKRINKVLEGAFLV